MLKMYGNEHFFVDGYPLSQTCMFCKLVEKLTFLDGPYADVNEESDLCTVSSCIKVHCTFIQRCTTYLNINTCNIK